MNGSFGGRIVDQDRESGQSDDAAGIDDEDVEAPELIHRLPDCPATLRRIAHVALDYETATTFCLDHLPRHGGVVVIHIVQDRHVCTFHRECHRDGATNA